MVCIIRICMLPFQEMLTVKWIIPVCLFVVVVFVCFSVLFCFPGVLNFLEKTEGFLS